MRGIIDSAQSIVTDGLLIHIDAGQHRSYAGTGNTLRDIAYLTENTASLVNGTTFSSEFGGSFVFDGTNDSIQWGHTQPNPTTISQPTLIPSNSFSMEFWFRPTTTHQIDAESNAYTVITGTSGQRYLLGVPLYQIGTQEQQIAAGSGVSAGTNGISVYEHSGFYLAPPLVWSGTVSSTLFTHGVVTYTNRQTRLYVNGSLVRTGLTTTRTVWPQLYTAGNGSYGAFPGRLAIYRVYTRPLTATEVLQNYDAQRSRFGL